VGNRLNAERLNFVQTFVFPRSHADLLPVRDAKKEQAAYQEQLQKEAGCDSRMKTISVRQPRITSRRSTGDRWPGAATLPPQPALCQRGNALGVCGTYAGAATTDDS
jgi:hypothetical protein